MTQRILRIPVDAQREMARLYSEGHRTAPELHRRLQIDKRVDEADLPSLRTVRRFVKDRAAVPSEPWHLEDGAAVEVALLLDVLAVVTARTEGRIRSLTKLEVHWLEIVLQARPELPPWTAYTLTSYYLARARGNRPTEDLDAFLAFAPWRSREARVRYWCRVLLGDVSKSNGWELDPGGVISAYEFAVALASEWMEFRATDGNFLESIEASGWDADGFRSALEEALVKPISNLSSRPDIGAGQLRDVIQDICFQLETQ